jgi:hypothetical protein
MQEPYDFGQLQPDPPLIPLPLELAANGDGLILIPSLPDLPFVEL